MPGCPWPSLLKVNLGPSQDEDRGSDFPPAWNSGATNGSRKKYVVWKRWEGMGWGWEIGENQPWLYTLGCKFSLHCNGFPEGVRLQLLGDINRRSLMII